MRLYVESVVSLVALKAVNRIACAWQSVPLANRKTIGSKQTQPDRRALAVKAGHLVKAGKFTAIEKN